MARRINGARKNARGIVFFIASIEQIFVRYEPDHLVLFWIAHDAERIAAVLHGLDRFAIKTPQEDHSFIGRAQMLGRAVVDRPLALLRGAVLIAAREPADRIVPAIDALLGVDNPLL